jgi:hypothetical protein
MEQIFWLASSIFLLVFANTNERANMDLLCRATILNNAGVHWLERNDIAGAIHAFRDAVNVMKEYTDSGNDNDIEHGTTVGDTNTLFAQQCDALEVFIDAIQASKTFQSFDHSSYQTPTLSCRCSGATTLTLICSWESLSRLLYLTLVCRAICMAKVMV